MGKYRTGGEIVENIDTYVRITTRASTDCPMVRVTAKERPKSADVAAMLADMLGVSWPNSAQLTLCSRAAADAQAEWDAKKVDF